MTNLQLVACTLVILCVAETPRATANSTSSFEVENPEVMRLQIEHLRVYGRVRDR